MFVTFYVFSSRFLLLFNILSQSTFSEQTTGCQNSIGVRNKNAGWLASLVRFSSQQQSVCKYDKKIWQEILDSIDLDIFSLIISLLPNQI
jgi:hypothetical protein